MKVLKMTHFFKKAHYNLKVLLFLVTCLNKGHDVCISLLLNVLISKQKVCLPHDNKMNCHLIVCCSLAVWEPFFLFTWEEVRTLKAPQESLGVTVGRK